MSIAYCVIKGDAAITTIYNDDRTVQRLEWLKADPAIHVTKELLEQADPAGLRFLKAKYALGEECPFDRTCVHARLVDS